MIWRSLEAHKPRRRPGPRRIGPQALNRPPSRNGPTRCVAGSSPARRQGSRRCLEVRAFQPRRHPGIDNALLSFAYSLLVKDLTIVCHAVWFDPFIGFYHQPRFGRPALALDLMEEFRPLVADSAVLSAINMRMVTADDFVRVGPAVALNTAGRRGFIRAYEQRIDTLVTHPLFAYRVNYRRVLEIQARLLARVVTGELSACAGFARVVSCRGPRPRPAASERTPARRNPVLTDPAQSALQRRRDKLLPTRGPAQAAIEAGERHLAPVAHERQRGSHLDRIVAA